MIAQFKTNDLVQLEVMSSLTEDTVNYATIQIGNYSTKYFVKTKTGTGAHGAAPEPTKNLIGLFIRFINTFKTSGSGSSIIQLLKMAETKMTENLSNINTETQTDTDNSFNSLYKMIK